MHLSLTDRILVSIQRWLPARFMGACVYRLSRSEISWLKNALIRGFSLLYGVETADASMPVPAGYRSFNEFFTRSLRPGARALDAGAATIVSPADGTIAQLGCARDGLLIQAKGVSFGAADLLGDSQLAAELANCHYATIYLAPYNYHRLHMPLDGVLEQTLFIPGLLYSVNARTTAAIPGLYALNERLVCQFSSPAGRFALVLVGAMNVASISTAWGGEITPPANGSVQATRFDTDTAPRLARGDYMGHFNMGSTIVLLGPPEATGWCAELAAGDKVLMGQRLGQLATKSPQPHA